MKRSIILLIVIAVFYSYANAQPVLTYANNALKADVDNPMSYCNYRDAGLAGENITWNFSDLEFVRSFTGYLKNSILTEIGVNFSESNTELAEFDARFYFNVNENDIKQYGYSSADGKLQTRYELPFVKMKYPFSYGDIFSGSFTGTTFYAGIERGEITGFLPQVHRV